MWKPALHEFQQWRRQRKIVAEEIEDGNTNLTITKTINRLGKSSSICLQYWDFHICIPNESLIFSQVLFIIYAMFLPVELYLLSMIPSFDGIKRATS